MDLDIMDGSQMETSLLFWLLLIFLLLFLIYAKLPLFLTPGPSFYSSLAPKKLPRLKDSLHKIWNYLPFIKGQPE